MAHGLLPRPSAGQASEAANLHKKALASAVSTRNNHHDGFDSEDYYGLIFKYNGEKPDIVRDGHITESNRYSVYTNYQLSASTTHPDAPKEELVTVVFDDNIKELTLDEKKILYPDVEKSFMSWANDFQSRHKADTNRTISIYMRTNGTASIMYKLSLAGKKTSITRKLSAAFSGLNLEKELKDYSISGHITPANLDFLENSTATEWRPLSGYDLAISPDPGPAVLKNILVRYAIVSGDARDFSPYLALNVIILEENKKFEEIPQPALEYLRSARAVSISGWMSAKPLQWENNWPEAHRIFPLPSIFHGGTTGTFQHHINDIRRIVLDVWVSTMAGRTADTFEDFKDWVKDPPFPEPVLPLLRLIPEKPENSVSHIGASRKDELDLDGTSSESDDPELTSSLTSKAENSRKRKREKSTSPDYETPASSRARTEESEGPSRKGKRLSSSSVPYELYD